MSYSYFPTKIFLHTSLILLSSLVLGNQALAACNPAQILRDDVLVVVNDNSISSPIVGDYYCNKRGINPANVAHVRVPVTNDVQLDQFVSLRDQLIKHMQENTLPFGTAPIACDTSKGYTRYYCPESIDQLRQKSKIHYVVTTKGVPIRFNFTDSPLPYNPEASIDNYLRFWLTNYFSQDTAFRINNRAIDFGDGRGMRSVDPVNDQELIVGRIDGVDTESAKRLVDRAINAEKNGIYGKLYSNKFGGQAFSGGSEGAHWRSWLPGGGTKVVYPSSDYLHGLFGEFQSSTNLAVRHTTNPDCLSYDSSGRVPKECVTAVNRGAISDNFSLGDEPPGTPGGRIESPDNALVHHGYLDRFSSLIEFDHLLNWRDSESCNTLCADAPDVASCKALSTDAYKEIDTRCVRVAEGYMGYHFNSYPVGMMASWPTGWFQSINYIPEKFDLTGGSSYYYWQPEVRKDEGFDDNFSLWYRNIDTVPSAACYTSNENYQASPTRNCNLDKKININQRIIIAERAINPAKPQKIVVRFKYRSINLKKDVNVSARLTIRESIYDDGAIKISSRNQIDYGNSPVLNLKTSDVNSWRNAEVIFTLDPNLHKHPNYLYDGVRISINAATAFEGEFAFDNFSVEIGGENIPLINPSFNDGHRQLSGGDSAATFLSRLNGTAFWGNLSHHESNGHSFDTHPYETLIYFMRGLPLGDAVWFAEIHNAGILYGDPLYSPVAVHLRYLTPVDSWARDQFSITHDSPLKLIGDTLNGSSPNVSTTYSLYYCRGDDFLPCDQNGSWKPIANMQNRTGGQRNMSLGNWDISSIGNGDYVLRLAVTSSNSTTSLSQTFYDYYPIKLYTPGLDDDGDSLSYLDEIAAGTNPNDSDTDNDSLPDDWELKFGLDPLTENTNADSDGDGVTDHIEFLNGTDPSDSNSTPIVTILNVDPVNGTDDGDSPFKTIEAALAVAAAGDKILLSSGSYNQDFIYFPVPVLFEGPADQSAIFKSVFLLWNRSAGTTTISNINFSSTDLTIGGDVSGNRWLFKNNYFSTNTKIISDTSFEFINNIFTNASNTAIELLDDSKTVLRNNTVTGNNIGISASTNSSVQIINSIISGNSTNDLVGVSPSAVSYSLIGDILFAGTNGNISGDPLFVDPLNGDFHLMPESPAIDAGDPQSVFSLEPSSTGRINLGAYGNTGEATITSGGNNEKSSGSGQVSGLLLLWFSLYGLIRIRMRRKG